MKSDADVVMTPEHAKKVFQSKSSAQRRHHLWIYTLLVLAILSGVFVYTVYEWADQADNIEASLSPLMRDPLPGPINTVEEGEGNLFEQTGVDAKTIELVQSAENEAETGESISGVDAVETESTEVAETDTRSEIDGLVEEEGVDLVGTIASETTVSVEPETAAEVAASIDTASAESAVDTQASVPTSGVIANENAAQIAASQSDSPNLHIVSSSRLEERHALLREAYTAYLAGNDDLALDKYNEVLEIDPNNRNALLARAAINVQNKNVGSAIQDYRQLLLANPKDTLAMTSLIAVANVSPADAESQLKLMIRDEPNSPYLNFALANAYGAQKRWREAQSHYFTALENNPGDPNYAYNLAVSLEHIAKPKVAVSYYQRALDNMKNGLAMFSKEVVDQRLEKLGKL